MNRITALALLTMDQHTKDNICIACKHPSAIFNEVVSNKGLLQHFVINERIGLAINDQVRFFDIANMDRVRGYRFDKILVEGSFENAAESALLQEILIPLVGVTKHLFLIEKLSKMIDGEIKNSWIKGENIIFTED